MNVKSKIFYSPPFYIRSGLFLLAMVLIGLLVLHTNSITWFIFKFLSAVAVALIIWGIVAYFKTLSVKLAIYKILIGLFKLVMGFIILCGVIAALLFWLADPYNLSAPTDQKLIALFHDHREAFEKLRQMATNDRGQTAHITPFGADGNITEARKHEYKSVLSEIYPLPVPFFGRQVTADSDGWVTFMFAGGLEWDKGIKYIPENSEVIGTALPNLDKANSLPPDWYLREIEPGWYIFYQSY